MTSWQEPNGRLPFVDGIGNKLSAAHLNALVANQRLTFEASAANWGDCVSPITLGLLARTFSPAPGFWDGAALWTSYVGASDRGLVAVYPNGFQASWAYTGSISTTSAGAICRVPSTGVFEWFPWTASDNYYTIGHTLGWPSGSASSVAYGLTSMRGTGPAILVRPGVDDSRVVPAGRVVGEYTKIAVLSAVGSGLWTATVDSGNTYDGAATAAASNGSGIVLVVGQSRYGRSTDYGATWTWGALPTASNIITSAGSGVAFDATRNVFVLTRVCSNGTLIWATSSDGATWQAYRSISNAPLETPWISVIDGTWAAIISYPWAVGTNPSTALILSYDAGASWFVVQGGARPFTADMTDGATGGPVACGNRFAVSNQYVQQFSGIIASATMLSSAAYT